MPGGLDSCIRSIFEPGNPGNATDSGSISRPSYPISVAVLEAAAATDAASAVNSADVTLAETATAADTPDGSVTSPPAATTWNPSDKTASMTLSGGNLTATGTAGGNQGVRSIAGQIGGKFYFEVLCTNVNAQAGGPGVVNPTVNLATFVSNVIGGAMPINSTGAIFVNGSNVGSLGAAVSAGQTICVAVDLVNNRIWMRINGGNWNNSGSSNPAGNTGGLDISALFSSSVACHAVYGTTNGANVGTANFGATSFGFTVPIGFSAGPV